MVVYADLLFVFNLFIDAVLLAVTARIRHLTVRKFRLLLAACLGASYVVVMFVPPLSFLYTFTVKLFVSFAMLWISFGFRNWPYFGQNVAAFYMVNFAAAGAIFGVRYITLSYRDVLNGILFSRTGGGFALGEFGPLFILFVLLAMVWLLPRLIQSLRKRERLTRALAGLEVTIDGVKRQCMGLIDTGNQLTDPLSGAPVMIMEASLWKERIPESWQKRLQSHAADQLLLESAAEHNPWLERYRLVPYRGVNNEMKFMLALKPDKVVITRDEGAIVANKVLIGLDGGVLSSDGSYRAIIHPGLFA
ncbi:MAG TPA: sigma-E processing peptidase SpoIIGA [Bacilli bacterium]